jgi:hypothetical protein
VVGALMDGLDLVVVQPPQPVGDGVTRQLINRARPRGTVLLVYSPRPWPGNDLIVEAVGHRWHGLEVGRGRLRHYAGSPLTSETPTEAQLQLSLPSGTPAGTLGPRRQSAGRSPPAEAG